MKNRAQSSIEFVIGFVCTILFIILTCNLFVWFNHCLVRRQVAYEDTRKEAGSGLETSGSYTGNPGKADFYTPPRLDVFKLGGR